MILSSFKVSSCQTTVEPCLKTIWRRPFAPRSLQTLHHYYEQLRPSITHWYSHTHKLSYLYFSLNIAMTGSRSSHWKPATESRPLYAGHRLHSIRNWPASLSWKIETPPVLMPLIFYDASTWVRLHSSLCTTLDSLFDYLFLNTHHQHS